ncbi:MAG: UbiX family flavin prenyltransferase [Calditerrivibrio sp.]|nr:UbiX family flavin prenyltransferase [Calditerrivibrio sp.]
MKIFLGITGASGALYGLRLINELNKKRDVELHISITQDGVTNINLETDLKLNTPFEIVEKLSLNINKTFVYDVRDFAARPSSGSFKIDKYIICPASMGFVGRVSAGVSSNLLERVSDVALKENRDLVVVFREAPLNQIHLENLLKLSRAGAKIIPAAPAFYHNPNSIEDLVLFVVGKIFDIIDIEHELFQRWGAGYENGMQKM